MEQSTSAAALTALMAELRAAGYPTDPSQQAAAEYLLLLVAAGAWPNAEGRISYLLAPIFAQSPVQQTDVIQRIVRWEKRWSENVILEPLRGERWARIMSYASPWRLRSAVLPAISVGIVAVALIVIGSDYSRVLDVPKVTIIPSLATASTKPPMPTGPNIGWLPFLPAMLAILPPLTGFGYWFFIRNRHRATSREPAKETRDLAELSILTPAIPLFEEPGIESAARDFARPRRLLSDEIDIEKSLDETARQAGLSTAVMKERTSTPHYVVLIEEAGRHDHLARLGDRLSDRMRTAGVLSERYYLVTTSLVRSTKSHFEMLKHISDRHSEHRLLVFGPGEMVIDSRTGKLVEELGTAGRWSDCCYLVAGRIDALTVKLLLAQGFAIAPMTRFGLGALGNYLANARREGGEVFGPLPGVEQITWSNLGSGPERATLGTSHHNTSDPDEDEFEGDDDCFPS